MKLGLGTVQFGFDYGISNISGKTSLPEANRILKEAALAGIDMIDTASLYGDSEAVIGKAIADQPFKLVTKTPQFNANKITKEHADQLKDTLIKSKENLSRNFVYGLLIHNVNDLFVDGGEYLIQALIELKEKKMVQKIGISAYTTEQIEKASAIFDFDLIQLPLNVFDQNLDKNGTLKELKRHDVEVHVRSIFLQGLLLTEFKNTKKYFAEFKQHITDYQSVLNNYNLTLIQGALAYINSVKEVDYAIVGVSLQKELIEIVNAIKTMPIRLPNFDDFQSNNQRLIDPLIWLAEDARNT